MENETIQTPIAPIAPVTSTSPESPVANTVPVKPNKKGNPIFIIIISLLIALSVLAGYVTSRKFQTNSNPDENVNISPTITQMTNQGINPIATTSAFLQIEEAIASLSARIAGFNPIDPQIIPPVLDLPLGFSN